MKALDAGWHELAKAAQQAMANAYVPYSQFKVGAALRTQSGEIITGCNIENASYSLTICAERTALFTAYSSGHTALTGMAIIAGTVGPISPCGACRQVMLELCAESMPIVLLNTDGDHQWTTVSELLPDGFKLT